MLKKNIFYIMAIIMIPFLLSSCETMEKMFEESPPVFIQKDSGKTVDLNVGREFDIGLDSNPSTGYIWTLEPYDEYVLKQVDLKYKRYAETIGSGGLRRYVFQVVGVGKTTLTFKYSRLWEKGIPPKKTFTLTVNSR